MGGGGDRNLEILLGPFGLLGPLVPLAPLEPGLGPLAPFLFVK